jgi:predicted MPP superfamily phosphohydrolase
LFEDDRYLYVSAGLGTSGIPLRIGVRPEFAVLDVNGS